MVAPKLGDERLARRFEESGDIVVEGIAILDEPVGGHVLDLEGERRSNYKIL